MTLEEIYYIGQTIAVVAIFGSLVYVAIQTRQNSRLVRARAIWDAQTSIAEINERLADGGLVSQLVFKFTTSPDKYQMHRHFRALILRTEAQFALHKNGVLDAEIWQLRRKWFRGFMNNPGFMEVWRAEKSNAVITRAFMQEMDTAEAADSSILIGMHGPREFTQRERQ
jgi:hypothetical protein